MGTQTDAIVVGGGLAGLVAATEAAEAGLKVVILEQESEANLGGQAFWSLGGLFMVDTPEQRRFGIKDSFDLAWADWRGAAGFDRDEDHWPQKWARAYVEFAAGEKREWLRSMGHRIFPVVGWAERGGIDASSHGNSVPRFHITWGTGPGTVEVFENRARAMADEGKITFKFRHQVDDLIIEAGACVGVKGSLLAEDNADRGKPTNRDVVGDFEMRAPAVIVCSGGIGGNLDLVRQSWPERLGKPPSSMIKGVPAHVDGRMIGISEGAGANTINKDRMWHYVEGVRNWDPIWPDHAIRILPGPSSMWFDATGKRMVEPNYPGYDSLGSLEAIMKTGYDYTWFITTQSIIKKEFALSGSEQNPDLTGKNWKMVAGRAFGPKATGPVEAFKEHGEDFVVADTLPELIAKMNGVAGTDLLDVEQVQRQIEDRDRQLDNKFTKDQQIMGIRTFRNYLGDKLIRTAKPHKILDPKHGPLIGVRLNILTRKTLGGLETDLGGRCFRQEEGRGAQVMPGLYAAGEVSGFGGGGYHGYRALEGTFLGGCIFSGRQAGRAAAGDVK
ncbi:FAD-binding dehydrogenase [Shimia thalassica]|uniref:FAD-binding dehydrogenase n=1 Tax=Shimia thalassica TaxID=1715693 RepID=UPI0027330336|nr:FAD-binding dehydrogenase [Shimia thalassica]MDP2519744.1 FAD-binding dehydrogenase [Shimia thalassica]